MVITTFSAPEHSEPLWHVPECLSQSLWSVFINGNTGEGMVAAPVSHWSLSWLLIGQFSLSIATSGMFSRSGNSPESIFSPELTILTNISHWVTRPGAGRGRRRQPYILFENFKCTINRRPCRQLAKGDKHYLYHLLLSAEKTSLFHNKVSWDTKTLFNTTY